jgi:hypothetical protein
VPHERNLASDINDFDETLPASPPGFPDRKLERLEGPPAVLRPEWRRWVSVIRQ